MYIPCLNTYNETIRKTWSGFNQQHQALGKTL